MWIRTEKVSFIFNYFYTHYTERNFFWEKASLDLLIQIPFVANYPICIRNKIARRPNIKSGDALIGGVQPNSSVWLWFVDI